MAQDFYAMTSDETSLSLPTIDTVLYPARIAVYDDPSFTPRVVIIEPQPVRNYLEEITSTVYKLAHEQGSTIPFMIIREIVENYIHAYFISPTVSILDEGETIRFSDQGPGIEEKERALEYGTTSATEEMKIYIRGVGSGLPIAQHYMLDKGGTLTIEDNLRTGTVVTISTRISSTRSQNSPSYLPKEDLLKEDEEASRNTVTNTNSSYTHIKSQTSTHELDVRSLQILVYVARYGSVGPSDLTATYGGSQPTWSRALQVLDKKGLLKKEGQKRHLTSKGKSIISILGDSLYTF